MLKPELYHSKVYISTLETQIKTFHCSPCCISVQCRYRCCLPLHAPRTPDSLTNHPWINPAGRPPTHGREDRLQRDRGRRRPLRVLHVR